jgi:hypothetical protein
VPQVSVAAGRRAWWTAIAVGVTASLVTRLWLELCPARWSFSAYDLFFLFLPAHQHIGQELAAGRLPLWNWLLGLGMNEGADIQFAPFYPPNLVFTLLPAAYGIELLTVAHIALAAGAVFALARVCGLAAESAAVAAIAVAGGEAFNDLSSWTTMLATFAWCPVAFLAARRLADSPGAGRALALGVVLGLQLLAGYLQFHLYTALCLPLFMWSTRQPRNAGLVPALRWLMVAEAIALGLGAIEVVPAFAALEGSIRSAAALPSWFYDIFPVRLPDYRAGLAAPALDAHAPVYAGVLVPLLALVAIPASGLVPRLRLPALLLVAGAVVLSLGSATPIFPLLWRSPFAVWFTGPYKWTYFAALGMSLLAGVGAEALRHAPGRLVRACSVALGAALLAVVPFPTWALLLGAGTLLGLALLPLPRPTLVMLVPLLTMVALLPGYQVRRMRPKDAPDFFARYHPAYRFLSERQGDGATFVLIPPLAISPRQGEMEGVAQVNTNGTFMSVRLDRFQKAVREAAAGGAGERAVALLRSVGVHFVMTTANDAAWLGGFGLRRVFTSPAADVWEDAAALPRVYVATHADRMPGGRVLPRLGEPLAPSERAVVLEDEEGDDAAGGAGRATLVSSGPTLVRVAVDSEAPAPLVLLDAWSREWRATVDGSPAGIRHANLLGRAVEVPAGRHEVVFRFVPVAFYVGAAASIVTLVGCMVVVAGFTRSPRARSDRVEDS